MIPVVVGSSPISHPKSGGKIGLPLRCSVLLRLRQLVQARSRRHRKTCLSRPRSVGQVEAAGAERRARRPRGCRRSRRPAARRAVRCRAACARIVRTMSRPSAPAASASAARAGTRAAGARMAGGRARRAGCRRSGRSGARRAAPNRSERDEADPVARGGSRRHCARPPPAHRPRCRRHRRAALGKAWAMRMARQPEPVHRSSASVTASGSPTQGAKAVAQQLGDIGARHDDALVHVEAELAAARLRAVR